MKRMIHSLLAAAVLVSAMTCTAFAGDYTMDKTDDASAFVGSVVTNDEGNSYTVSYDGATDGNQYVVLVVKKDADGTYDASKAENILYINQAAASGNTITFNGLIPMTNANAVVLLGGVFAGQQSPIILGELVVPFTLGDVIEDGEILADDALCALQIAIGAIQDYTPNQYQAADVIADGEVLADDALRILQYAIGAIQAW